MVGRLPVVGHRTVGDSQGILLEAGCIRIPGSAVHTQRCMVAAGESVGPHGR